LFWISEHKEALGDCHGLLTQLLTSKAASFQLLRQKQSQELCSHVGVSPQGPTHTDCCGQSRASVLKEGETVKRSFTRTKGKGKRFQCQGFLSELKTPSPKPPSSIFTCLSCALVLELIGHSHQAWKARVWAATVLHRSQRKPKTPQ
jgi:hypothetical protein